MKKSTKATRDEHSEIVLNRMYVGGYLHANLGHEVINFFQADNGCNYLYLNATGDFAAKHQGCVRDMLFVKYYAKDVFEVIGLARGLQDVFDASTPLDDVYTDDIENNKVLCQQKRFIEQEGGISYGGKCITEIFKGYKQQSIFITYKADAVYRPVDGKHIFIRFNSKDGDNKPENAAVAELKNTLQAKASLKQYFRSDKDSKDYDALMALIEDESLWKEHKEQVQADRSKPKDGISGDSVSIFDICNLNDSETAFSSALAYFIEYYPKLWIDFFKTKGAELEGDISVTTEEDATYSKCKQPTGGRIDILIRSKKSWIVIENKIKSDINTKKSDIKTGSTQLDRYYNYVTATIENLPNKPEPHFYVLAPEYNKPEIGNENYELISYREVYDFLKDRPEVASDANFNAFVNAMKRHTYDNANDYLYYEMQNKFFKQILKPNAK